MSKKGLTQDGDLRSIPTGWKDAFAICRKCSKKLDGGFGEGQRLKLRKALQSALREAGKRGQVGIFEAGCFGLCPKRAVTVALSSRPDALLVVPEGSAVEKLVLLSRS